MIADVVGWYGPSDERGRRFIPVTPTRIVDSRPLVRSRAGSHGDPGGRAGIAPIVPVVDVEAVALERHGRLAHRRRLTPPWYPDDDCQGPPFAAASYADSHGGGGGAQHGLGRTLGWHPSCSQRGSVEIYNPVGSTHVLVDVFGWFTGDTPP